MKYSKEVLITRMLIAILKMAILTGLMAALSYLLSSCSGLQTQIRGNSHIYRSDSIHTVFYYDHPQRSTIKVDY